MVRINKQSLTSFRLAAVLAGRTFAQKRSNLLAVPFPSSFPVSSVPLLLGDTVFFTSMFFSPCFIILINKLSLVLLHQGCLHKIHIYGLGLNNTWTKDRKTHAKKVHWDLQDGSGFRPLQSLLSLNLGGLFPEHLLLSIPLQPLAMPRAGNEILK